MKKILVVLAAMLGVMLFAGCSSGGGKVETVDPQGFLSTSARTGVVTVDVRTPAEYAAGHLDGAINIDVEAPTFDTAIATLDKGATYAVYCHSGRRSGIATQAMDRAGFTAVYNLKGGYPDLVSAGAAVSAS